MKDQDPVPRWSVMIPTYNPTGHLREALAAVLEAQRSLAEPMQIEIVDDASPSVDVAALVAGWGLSGIVVFRRPANGGLAACWNACIERARGTWVHLLHQDDLVSPLFYSRMNEAAERFPQAGMIFSRNFFLVGDKTHLADEEQPETGPIDHWLERICTCQRVQCPAVVMRRSTYQTVGGFDPSLRWVIDWEMWIRVAVSTTVVYVAEPLATYRVHAGAETSRLKNSGAIVGDLARGLARISAVLRRADRPECIDLAVGYVWDVSAATASEAQSLGRPDLARRELGASLRHFGARVGLRLLLKRLRWYARLCRERRRSEASPDASTVRHG
jgi:glycosyltransferase involved in cell wall biosynthesis